YEITAAFISADNSRDIPAGFWFLVELINIKNAVIWNLLYIITIFKKFFLGLVMVKNWKTWNINCNF
ncbi:MAG: hypothetical protein O4753_13520, partial [Trichodesmium sp. St7_bin2_1]|nr:hypothetical protein [Trichodesmium sp. St7_bin2_1]